MEETQPSKITVQKECSNATLEYADGIVIVRVKEGVEINIPSMKEQYEVQKTLVGDDDYAVLVDGTKNSMAGPETRQFMANHKPPKRKATAIITNHNLSTQLIANFYLRFHQPKVPTRLFRHEEDAMNWLKHILENNKS